MRRAFTLIEMMVTLALVAVVFSFTISSFRTANRQQQVEANAEKFRQALRTARANVQAGKKNCQACGASAASTPAYACGTGDGPLLYWRVVVNTGVTPPTYTVNGYCVNPTSGVISFSSGETNKVSTPLALTAVAAGVNRTLLTADFLPGGGGVRMTATPAGPVFGSVVWTFTYGGVPGGTKTVTLNAQGEVN